MAGIDITSAGSTPLNDGILQLETGVPMDSTLRNVADQNDTTSPLKLSTTAVQVVSPLRITTDDPSDFYLDCEDGATNNRFSITRNTASQQVNLNFSSNPAGSTTQVGAIRTFTDGVNLGEVVKFREDGQVTFTERVNVEADSLATTQSSSVISASTTNANLVIAPNGTGALVASIPDGTATGGNARGVNAVDLQTSRGSSTQVAVGSSSVVVGGSSNTASGNQSVVVGGQNNVAGRLQSFIGGGNSNTISSPGGENAIVGGTQNTNSGTYGFIGAGLQNTVSASYGVVSGGQANTASTNTHATVVGGSSNTSSGQYSIAGGQTITSSGSNSVGFGRNNTASGTRSVALGGEGAVASGTESFAFGGSVSALAQNSVVMGFDHIGNSTRSFAVGGGSSTYLTGQFSLSQGKWGVGGAANGNAQQSLLTAKKEDTLNSAATTVLSLDGTGTTNLIIPSGTNRMWNVQVRWVSVVTDITGTATGVTIGDTKTSTDLLAVAKRGGVTTVSAHTSAGTHAIETVAGSLTAANITYSAGASQEMAITFTGPTFAGGGSVTMRVVAAISLTEVAY